MLGNILINFLWQVGLTLGVILIYGLLIGFSSRLFYANFGRKSRAICYITGFFGTPVHELAHALFCLIFGHKILEIKLYQINSQDGTLGYVRHSYNKRNFYQKMGNFFIGIAPILVISAILYALSLWLVPGMMNAVVYNMQGISAASGFAASTQSFFGIFAIIFSYMGSWKFWVFILIGIFLSLHMTLSGPDIKGAASGLISLLLVYLILDVVFYLLGMIGILNAAFAYIAAVLNTTLFLSLLISIIALLISFIWRLIFRKH